MSDENKSYGYLGFKRGEDNRIDNFYITSKLFDLESWLSADSGGEARRLDDVEPKADATVDMYGDFDSRPALLMDRFRKSMVSTQSLILFIGTLFPVMKYAMLERHLFRYAEKNLTIHSISEQNKSFIYSREQWPKLKQALDEFFELIEGHMALPKAVLLSLVATFDSYFAEIVQFFPCVHPERYTSSDKQISLREVFLRKSIDEVIDHVIDDEINALMRGSHTDQVKFIEDNLEVKIIGHYERWPEFVEIFERRNLVAHGNLVVNRAYRKRCEEAKLKMVPELGTELNLEPEYLDNAVDILAEFGILLIFTLWKKHLKDADEFAFRHVSRVTYELIANKKYVLAKNLLEFCLYKQKRSCSDSVIKMMIVNLANCSKKIGREQDCNKTLSGVDWSASKDEYQICIASLKHDTRRVIELMPTVASSKAVTALDFREWPVFDWVRDDPKVVEAFEKVYGEPIQIPKAISGGHLKSSDDNTRGSSEADVETTEAASGS